MTLDLQSKSKSIVMNCISGCAAVTQNVHIVLPKNSLNSKCGQGHIVSVALQGLLICS